MKPKTNTRGDKGKSSIVDRCQTPDYALGPIVNHLRGGWAIWEPAAGEGNIVSCLTRLGYPVFGTDVLDGRDFFEWSPDFHYDCIVTNPPYSVKYHWLDRCYSLGKPFALLMPVETLGSQKAQVLFEKNGIEIILLSRRVNFKMPNKGYAGGGAQFPVAWFTFGFGIGSQLSFSRIEYDA